MFGSVNWTLTVLDGEVRLRVPYAAVSASFLRVLGTRPAIGRLLDVADESGAEPRTVLVSDRFWKQYLGADPQVIGRAIRVLEEAEARIAALEIVGVMPEAFDCPSGALLWLPAEPSIRSAVGGTPTDQEDAFNNLRVFYALGRLRPDSSVEAARDEITTILRQDAGLGRSEQAGPLPTAVVTTVEDVLLGPAKPVLWTMLAGSALMVLLACASIAALQLFRSAQQDQSFAVQLALGASRARLIRRSLFEGLVLAAVATTAAILVGWVVTQALVHAAPLEVPRLSTSHMRASAVLLTMVVLTTTAGMLTGVWPAVFIGHIDPGSTLITGRRTAMHPRGCQRPVRLGANRPMRCAADDVRDAPFTCRICSN